MTETEVIFHNNAEIRVQAQIFTESTLVSTCVANPGETCTLLTQSVQYDVYLKNGMTGWEVARKLNSAAKSLALSRHKGRYVIT